MVDLLKPTQRYMMDQISRRSGEITQSELTKPGGKSADELKFILDAGYIKVVPHKSQIDPVTKRPPDAFEITPLGREVMELDGR